MQRADIALIEDDEPEAEIAICGACSGTGESGRFGQLVCRPCRGSGEVFDTSDCEDEDPRADGSWADAYQDWNSDR
jgi:hypothetical protein